jgi:hypothetical protein
MADEFLFPMTSRYSYSSSLYNGDSDGEFCEPGTCSSHVLTNPEYSISNRGFFEKFFLIKNNNSYFGILSPILNLK